MIKVLIADDQELVRSGFAAILQMQPDLEVVAEAADGAEAVELVRAAPPDVVLLDVRMPAVDGLAAAEVICAESLSKVIMLTTYDIDEYVYRALEVGASGFLLKDVRRDDLVAAVRSVAAGDAFLAPQVTGQLIAEFRRGRRPPVPSAPDPRLSEREHQTWLLIARGLTNAEIAEALVISPHTAKTHVSNVLSKLGLRDRVQATIHAYERGLLVPGAGSDKSVGQEAGD